MGESTRERLQIAIQEAHDRARHAYVSRDAEAYMAVFHPQLRYTRSGAPSIGREQLARDIHDQLGRAESASSIYRRESLCAKGTEGAVEVIEQLATYRTRAFVLVHREWTVRRRSCYEWMSTPEGWQIIGVDVLSEEVTSSTWLGFR